MCIHTSRASDENHAPARVSLRLSGPWRRAKTIQNLSRRHTRALPSDHVARRPRRRRAHCRARGTPPSSPSTRTGAVVRDINRAVAPAAARLRRSEAIESCSCAPEKRALWTYGVEKESCERASVLPERPMSVCASRDGRFVASGTRAGRRARGKRPREALGAVSSAF